MDKYIVAAPSGSTNNSVGALDRHWQKGYFDELPNWQEYLAESTGYGIISGCTPTISGLTVSVAAGVVHLADGTRKELSASTVTLDAADATKPRIDLVYIDSAGVVAKVTGTASATPTVPTLPSGGISVAQVTVAANATTGTVTDNRDIQSGIAKSLIVIPDMFDGNDLQKLQKAIDYAYKNNIYNIIIDRIYDLTGGTILLPKLNSIPDSWRYLHFLGVNGGFLKTDSGYMFSATNRTMGYHFENIRFMGCSDTEAILLNNTVTSVFNCSKILQIYTENCEFRYLKRVFDGTDSISETTCMQSIYTDRDIYFCCYEVLKTTVLWNVNFNNSNIEHCYRFITIVEHDADVALTYSLSIVGCTIESIEGDYTISIGTSSSTNASCATNMLIIENCYFELNPPIYDYGYIRGISIINNRFTRNVNNGYALEIHGLVTLVDITGNDCTITNKLLRTSNDFYFCGINTQIDKTINPKYFDIKDTLLDLPFKKSQDVTIDSITTSESGIADITSYKPSGIDVRLCAIVSVSGVSYPYSVNCNGTYLIGAASTTYTNVKIRYFYWQV